MPIVSDIIDTLDTMAGGVHPGFRPVPCPWGDGGGDFHADGRGGGAHAGSACPAGGHAGDGAVLDRLRRAFDGGE